MNQNITVIDHVLIEAVRQHLQEYDENILHWDDIAIKINRESKVCESQWLEIQYNYAKIKGLIRDRWELESVLQVHPKTRMYLDGSLNFLDPYINKMSSNTIPTFIHQRYNWVNQYLKVNKTTRQVDEKYDEFYVRQGKVQMVLAKRDKEKHLDAANKKYLIEVVGRTITQCIMRLKNNKEHCQTTDNAHKKPLTIETIFNKDSNNRGCVEDNEMMDPLSEDVVDDDIENMSINNLDLENNATSDEENMTHKTAVITSSHLEVKNEMADSEKIIENTLNETDLETYFSDLVKFVSDNFSLQKQKKLQSRVTQLVSELLDNNDSD